MAHPGGAFIVPAGEWLTLPIEAPAGCHRLAIRTAAGALHAELATATGAIPLPLERDGDALAATFRIDAPVELLRFAPAEGETIVFGAIALAPASPWRSLLPDWRIGPLALPPRPPGEAESPALAGPVRPEGWDARIAVDAVEAASLSGRLVLTGRAGVLRLRLDPPLPAGRHRVQGHFLAPGGGDARVSPRILLPGRARDPLDGVRLRALGDGRYGATLLLDAPASSLLLRPREERGSVEIAALAIRPASRLGDAARLALGALPPRPGARAAPIAIPPARARLCHDGRAPLATIVTPTRDAPHHLGRFLATVLGGTRLPLELVLVDNGTTDTDAARLLADASLRPNVRVVRDGRPFNFAALVNVGAAFARAPVLVLANNDLELPDGEWLAPLVDAALDPRVGVAGARLLYPDGRVQHDGVVLAGEARVEHAGRLAPAWRRPAPAPGTARPVTAVTGALMAIRTDLFESLGGMRADRYPVLLNDVDLSLRACRGGRLAVITAVTAVHHESATIGPPRSADPLARGGPLWRFCRAVEADRLRADWADLIDGRTAPSDGATAP